MRPDPAALTGSRATPEVVPSWEEVATQHGRFVYALAFRLTGSQADAEDLTQDVLLRVRTALARYRPGSLEGWLLRITTNLFYDRMRHRTRHRTEALDALVEPPQTGHLVSPPPSPEDSALHGELRAVVQEALAELPYQFRVAVVLCDLYQMSYEEISATMGWRLGTVRSRIHRGRALLRDRLAPYVSAPDAPGA
jgi:RNA polymerase sigma factor (sigma-70 family)